MPLSEVIVIAERLLHLATMPLKRFSVVLLGLTLIHLIIAVGVALGPGWNWDTLLIGRQPIGGDFINQYSAGRLVLAGQSADIYQPDRFMSFERGIVDADIGVRLWAYPPHSLLLSWPFSLLPYLPSLALWSLAGLVALVLASRRYGFSWIETAALVASPAVLQCLYFGQTGNVMAALMLVALSQRGRGEIWPVAAAAMLTVKPQAGFLLPLLWLMRRRWRLIALTAAATIVLAGVSVALFGLGAWRDYVSVTTPLLGRLETEGAGPFMLMIPTMFMSGRILGLGGNAALIVHGLLAVPALGFVIWRLRQIKDDGTRQDALILAATSLITPYEHNYDLALLSVAVLLIARRLTAFGPASRAGLVICLIAAWLLPDLVFALNFYGVPISPLFVMALVLTA